MAQLRLRKILIQHQQIVPEIEVGLAGTLLLQSGASHMIHHRSRHTKKQISPAPQAPAQINFLHMSKKTAVKSARFPISVQPDHQRRSRSPEHRKRSVILSGVGLYMFKYTSPAKRIAVAIHKSAGGTGIFKPRPVIIPQQFGLAGRHIGMPVHKICQRVKPPRSNFHIAVQQDDISGLNTFQRLIIAVGKTVITVQGNQADRRKFFFNHFP